MMARPDPKATPQACRGRGIVVSEAHSVQPPEGDFEKVARRRFQNPEPFVSGKWWYLLVRQDEFDKGRRARKRKRIKLAPADMPLREVQKIAAEHLRPLNQGLVTIGSATKFQDFVESTYAPVDMVLLASSTRSRTASVIKNHLMPAFGEWCLRDMNRLPLQRFLNGLNPDLAQESKDKVRDVLSAIMGSAVRYGLLVINPAGGLRLPPAKRGKRQKPFVTPEQFDTLIGLIAEPYASMVYVAGYTGLRVSEVVGLTWSCVGPDWIRIEQRYCRGDLGAPKSDASNVTIPVNQSVINRIDALKSLTLYVRAGRATRSYPAVKSDGPEDFVFQSVASGAPMRDNNILTRHIKPAARKLGIGWVNWQVLRRSYATWLKMVGADVKDAQALMRHSRASTTLDIYQQHVPQSQRVVVQKLQRLTERVQ